MNETKVHITTREEYAEMVRYNFAPDTIKRCFGCTKEDLENPDFWNQALEIAYSELYTEEVYEVEQQGLM